MKKSLFTSVTLKCAMLRIRRDHIAVTIPVTRKVAGSIPDKVIGVFNLPSPSSRITALGSTQSLTEMSTRNLPAGKGRSAHRIENLAAICEPIF
jgi:hypothetical protein